MRGFIRITNLSSGKAPKELLVEIVNRLRAVTSLVVPSATELRNAEHRELYLSGLRLAVGDAT
jgi:hypothetical protein